MNKDKFRCATNALADLATTSQLMGDKVAKQTLILLQILRHVKLLLRLANIYIIVHKKTHKNLIHFLL